MDYIENIITSLSQQGEVTTMVKEVPVRITAQVYDQIPFYMIIPLHKKPSHVVFFQHGFSRDKNFALPTCLELAEQGFLAIAMDARLHGARRPENFENYFKPELFLQSMGQTIEGTVQDISTLLTHIQAKVAMESSQAGIGGFSMGGYVSFIMPLMDARFTVAAPISGSPKWVEAEIPEQFADMIDQNIKKKCALEPLRHVNRLHHVAWLIQHGQTDQVVPIQGSSTFFNDIKPYYAHCDRIQGLFYPDTAHSYIPEMQNALVAWFHKHLKI